MPIAWCVPELPPKGAQRKRPQASIAKLPDAIKVVLMTPLFPSSRGTLTTEVSFARLEPCEGKLSRTVLRGV